MCGLWVDDTCVWYPQKLEEGVGSHRNGVTGNCEHVEVSAGDQTQDPRKAGQQAPPQTLVSCLATLVFQRSYVFTPFAFVPILWSVKFHPLDPHPPPHTAASVGHRKLDAVCAHSLWRIAWCMHDDSILSSPEGRKNFACQSLIPPYGALCSSREMGEGFQKHVWSLMEPPSMFGLHQILQAMEQIVNTFWILLHIL